MRVSSPQPSFVLPAIPSSHAIPSVNNLSGGGGGGGGGLRRPAGVKPKVLSVDDDPINQMVVQNLLAPEGYEVRDYLSL